MIINIFHKLFKPIFFNLTIMRNHIVIIQKTGEFLEKKINNEELTFENLYKKAGFRKNKDFDLQNTWFVNSNGIKYISVFAKDDGRANTENKFELPPPIDNVLYFGNMLIIAHSEKQFTNDTIVNLTEDEWKECYNKLMGGFEYLGDEDSYSEEEEIAPENLTKQGYDKSDGFVVEDNFIENADDSEEEEEYIPSEEDTEDSLDDDGQIEYEESSEEMPESENEDEEEEEEEDEDDKYDDEESNSSNELTEEKYEY